ncbi:hypothetical protein TIFTF001_022509 [Ficus carica]|uniref:Uncharacterized protein n=1 Tax=Ficus carica TaxID=3494 RepID=A0AA88AEM9_FICCA|nr:hypothetical protein TIFTF001_022509 [Ficus carica]
MTKSYCWDISKNWVFGTVLVTLLEDATKHLTEEGDSVDFGPALFDFHAISGDDYQSIYRPQY